MSVNQDDFSGRIIGNLISEPALFEDENGNKVCYCKVATNPKARKFDKAGKEIPPEERNKRRSFIELKVTGNAAEKFDKLFKEGDRAQLIGEFGTKRQEKGFWSKKEGCYICITVDVDEDRQNIQQVFEDKLMMWVEDFAKIVTHEGMNYLVHV